jgi:hypothetical protein
MTETTRERVLDPRLSAVGRALFDLTEAIRQSPDPLALMGTLEDHELLTIAAWTKDRDETVTFECRRRAEQARTFARYLARVDSTPSGSR